jgi:hypothetical protein
MKKKVEVDIKELEAEVISILNAPVSEGDNGGSPITLNDLSNLLEKKFEFSSEELCQTLSNLSFNCEIRVILKPGYNDSDVFATVDKIILGPGKKVLEKKD